MDKFSLRNIKGVIKSDDNPTTTTNLSEGTIWENITTGELFLSIDGTTDKNVWQGQLGTRIMPVPDSLDPFGDGSGVATFLFDGDANDVGGIYDGTITDAVRWVNGVHGQAVKSRNNSSHISIPLNYDKDVITFSFFAKWSGTSSVMPLGFDLYDIYLTGGKLGFNTANGDLYGIDNPITQNNFIHLVMEMHEGDYTNNKIWVDGQPQTLSQRDSSQTPGNAIIKNTDLNIFGWGADSGYRKFGSIDVLHIFNRALTDAEARQLANE